MAKKMKVEMMTIPEHEKLTGRKYEPSEEMTVDEYMDLYRKVLTLSMDAEGFGLFEMILDRDIEKAKIIRAIMEVLSDVPARRVNHIMEYKAVEYDYFEILDAAYDG